MNNFDEVVQMYADEKKKITKDFGILDSELMVLKGHYDRLQGYSNQVELTIERTIKEMIKKGIINL